MQINPRQAWLGGAVLVACIGSLRLVNGKIRTRTRATPSFPRC
jgi:hypothetical protein